MRIRRSLLIAFFVGVAAFSLLAAGCGGSANRGIANLRTSTTARGNTPPGGALVEYAHCMRSHRILNFPDSFGSSAAIKATKGQMTQIISEREASSPTFQAAQRACANYAPPSQQPTTHVSPQEMQKLLAVSRCMRAHGVPNFPDPNPITGALTIPAGIDKNSPQVLAALRACGSLGQAAGLGPPNTGQ